uniref:RNase H type-1 domain-containing protein n=1 Tax=Manihot esculenta TaxID=3983 RepID=A0A2C9W7Y8_MANES
MLTTFQVVHSRPQIVDVTDQFLNLLADGFFLLLGFSISLPMASFSSWNSQHVLWLACASTCVEGAWVPTISEVKAMAFGLKLASDLSFNQLIAQSDNKTCIDLLLVADCFVSGR